MQKKQTTLKINTSNKNKRQEFVLIFQKYNQEITFTDTDLPEIKADPIDVIVHKASQVGKDIIVEDTSLDIEGYDVGVEIKWVLDRLSEFKGKKAIWRVLLGLQQDECVYVYEGKIEGVIVEKKEESAFGFDPFFLPNGAQKTLAEDKPDHTNARALAVEAFLTGKPIAIKPIMESWDGPWQTNS